MNDSRKRFSWVELIVVLVIVAIVVSLVWPAYITTMDGDRGAAKALSNAKQIGNGLKMFALDYDGHYPVWTYLPEAPPPIPPFIPSALPNSNAVLATLLPDYLGDKRVFGITGSKWKRPNKPDGDISTDGRKLEAGENAWAYVAGLTETSNPRWPLLTNAFAQISGNLGSSGNPYYTMDEAQKGGLWRRRTTVLRCDGSVKVETTLDSSGKVGGAGNRHVPRDDDPTKNAFNYDAEAKWLTPDCAVLQPIPPIPQAK